MANYVAYTAPINRPGDHPILTIPQVWTGLERKIRAGQDFVGGSIIKATDVLEERREGRLPVTVREVTFADGDRRVKEVCKAYASSKVEFYQPDGSKVTNIVSEGPQGAENGDLWMTYAFEWLHPELEGHARGLEEKKEEEKGMAKMAVEHTIKAMREMVLDGRIKG